MTDLVATVAGLAVIIAAIASAALSALLLGRMQRHGGSVMEGMAQVVFLPEKRRLYLWLMSVEGSLFVLSGVCWGLLVTGVLPGGIGVALFAGLFLGGLVFLTSRSIVGLRPTVLSETDRATIERSAPEVLDSLAFIPLDPSESSPDSQQRLYVVALPKSLRSSSVRRHRRSR